MVKSPHKYTKLKNSNGDKNFGYLPELKISFKRRPEIIIPAGHIHLFYGNQVFGLSHILGRHGANFENEFEIIAFIERILVSDIGTEVFCEDFSANIIKPIVLRKKVGQVVLQYREGREGNNPHYSIVTAFPLSFSKNLGKKIGEF